MSPYAELRRRVDEAALRAGRKTSEVHLLGAAKAKPADVVVDACRAGLRHVGENFAQEARDKIPAVNSALKELGIETPSWHFIGRLQRNKVRMLIPWVDCVQSVDRLSLAEELDRRAGEHGRRLDVMLQVNVSGEASKGGVEPAEAARLLGECEGLTHLRVTGLMAIPAPATDPEAARLPFRRLRELRDVLRNEPGGSELRELSMGMSADFEMAIAEGATVVRVGTALFGARDRKP